MNFRSIVLLLAVAIPLKAQDTRNLEQRLTDYVKNGSSSRFLSATRYVPVMINRGLTAWSSPTTILEIDGMRFEAYPLNLASPDYAPVDLILAESIEITQRPGLSLSGSYPGGTLSFHTSEIPDSLTVRGRFYGGSETGDVILQEYTQDNLPFFNKNKTGPSAAVAVSEKTGPLGYRMMAGGFTYFSVGYADRDRILIPYIDLATFSRPNRHVLGSAELEYEIGKDRRISLTGGLNFFEAWEQVPFLPTFAFFSGSLGTVRFSARGVIPHFDFFAHRDGVSLAMKKQIGTEGGKYSGSVTSVRVVPNFPVTERIHVRLPVDYTVHTVRIPNQNRQLFTSNRDRSTWGAGIQMDVDASEWSFTAHARYEKGLNGSFLRSGSVDLRGYWSGDHGVEVHLSSIERSPSLLEMFGEFSTWRFRPSLARNDTFRVRGNSLLKPSRATGAEVTYSMIGEPWVQATIFAAKTDNLIHRLNSGMIRSASPGDLVFSGQYINAPPRTLGGLECSLGFALQSGVAVEGRYTFSENHNVPEIPRHQIRIHGAVQVTKTTAMTLTLTGATKTVWTEFELDALQNDRDGTGSDGVVSGYWSLDWSAQQNLGQLAVFKNVAARIELQNLLNRALRIFPLGVATDLTVMGYMSFGI